MIRLSDYALTDIMDYPIPSFTEQKRLMYRPTHRDVVHVYHQLNEHVFGNSLRVPKIEVQSHCRKYWGQCSGEIYLQRTGSFCHIRMMDKWFCPQWMVTILAHEMSHQYQWDVIGPELSADGRDHLMSHGPSFFTFRDELSAVNIPLKTAHSQRKWFKYQDLFKT